MEIACRIHSASGEAGVGVSSLRYRFVSHMLIVALSTEF